MRRSTFNFLNLVSGGLKKLRVEALILIWEMNKTFILLFNCGVRPIGVCNLLLTGFVRASEDLRANQSGLIFPVHQ